MKILHLLSQRPDSTGSGIYLQAMLEQGRLNGHENFLVAGVPASDIPKVPSIAPENCRFVLFESETYPEKIVGMSDIMPYPSRQFRNLTQTDLAAYLDQFKQTLRTAVQQYEPDIIHVNHLWLLCSLTRQLFVDIPITASSHGSELRQFTQCPDLQDYAEAGCRHLDGVCVLSRDQRSEIHTRYAIPLEQLHVTGAGFNEAIFYPPHQLIRSGQVTLLYGGKMSRAKGVPWLLHALQNLEHLDFHLHLAGGGSGPEYDECMEGCEILKGKVTYHGAVSQTRLGELMRSADCFILPSLHEGLPLVILEALACGCTVISTDLPGSREIAEHLPGAPIAMLDTPLVTDIDSTTLADEQSFVSDLTALLASQISSRSTFTPDPDVLTHFTWQEVFRRVERVWKECLDLNSSG